MSRQGMQWRVLKKIAMVCSFTKGVVMPTYFTRVNTKEEFAQLRGTGRRLHGWFSDEGLSRAAREAEVAVAGPRIYTNLGAGKTDEPQRYPATVYVRTETDTGSSGERSEGRSRDEDDQDDQADRREADQPKAGEPGGRVPPFSGSHRVPGQVWATPEEDEGAEQPRQPPAKATRTTR